MYIWYPCQNFRAEMQPLEAQTELSLNNDWSVLYEICNATKFLRELPSPTHSAPVPLNRKISPLGKDLFINKSLIM